MTHVCMHDSEVCRDVKWIVSHSAMYMESIQFYIMRALYRWRNSSILSICQHVSSQHARISDTSAVHVLAHTGTCICTPEEPNMSKRSCPSPWKKKERNCMQFSDQELQHIGKWKTLVHDDVLTERRRTGRHGSPGYTRGNSRRKIIIISRLTRYINSAQLCYYTVHTCIEAVMYMFVTAENTTSMNGETRFQLGGLNSALHCWILGY